MQPLARLSRILNDSVAVQDVIHSLEKKYTVEALPKKHSAMSFFDTFDWRLYAKNRVCYLENNTLHLIDFADLQQTLPLQLKGKPPRFWQEFPECDMKKKLAGYIDVRALLEQSAFVKTSERLNIVNRDKKIIAKVTFSETTLDKDKSYTSVQLLEVRGYNKWFLKLSRDLESFGKPQPDTIVQTLKTSLSASGHAPLDYSSGVSFALDPEMTSLAAAKNIYQNLLSTMLANIPGIIDDIDSEFLHDFRVAIRRTRSGLTMMKRVLPPEISQRFLDDFKFLGQITGPVRDLDVYLLAEDNYRGRLPRYLQEGLHFFFEELAGQRRREQIKLAKTLKAPRCKSILDEWQEYLAQSDAPVSRSGQKPVTVTAQRIIVKKLQRILRDGTKITPESPDADLHRLRIQGKKLRYALEFFSSLYPPKEMKQLIKQLKLLQNNLGDFNDLSVQQDMLKYSLSILKPGTVKAKKTSASIGGLLTNLYHEAREVRTHFEETFTAFSAPKNQALYRRLFR